MVIRLIHNMHTLLLVNIHETYRGREGKGSLTRNIPAPRP